MSTKELNLLDLGLDWKLAMERLGQDIRDDFWPDPLLYRDLLGSPDATLKRLQPQLAAYRPRQGVSYSIPKPNFTIRDSIHITAVDRLVYQALVDRLIPHIDPLLSANVFSHRLRSPAGKFMFLRWQQQHKLFNDTVKSALRDAGGFLVTTDIARYFEAISFRVLRTQLENLVGAAGKKDLDPCLDALVTCVQAWSPYDRYGLVQNVEASSFLGNALLDCVDKLMAKDGFPIFRYMDDIRILVPTESDARVALMRLICHLRDVGLGVNTQKTHILRADSPHIQEHLPDADPDVTTIEEAVGKKDRQAAQEIVELLFAKTNGLVDEGKPAKGSFKFCLNRITSLRAYRNLELPLGEEITDAVLGLLILQPDETSALCSYLEVAPLNASHEAEIQRLLIEEPLCVYPWQNFHLWRLTSLHGLACPELTLKAHRLLKTDPSNPEAAGAALYLGERGDYADRQAIAKLLPTAPRGLIARCYQVAIQQLHKADRSPAYAGIATDDPQAALLTEHIQGLHEPLYVADAPQVGIEDLPDAIRSVYG